MTGQAGDQMPTFEEVKAIADRDPVEAARLITIVAKRRCNLPTAWADLRKDCLRRARDEDGRKVSWLAAKVGLAMAGISRLTTVKTTAEATS